MERNGGSKNSVELWGHTFKKVKSGLDENEVVSFVTGLVEQIDTLSKRQDHLAALAKLAERTVAEADSLAEQIRKEATEQAEKEAEAVMAKAEKQSQKLIEEKRAEAKALAEKEAESIRADARQQAEQLLEERAGNIQAEMNKVTEQIYRDFVAHLDHLKQQATSFKTDFETVLSRPLLEADSDAGDRVEGAQDSHPAGSQEEAQPVAEAEAVEAEVGTARFEAKPTGDKPSPRYKEKVRLEMAPPVDVGKIMAIITYLENLPQVSTTELIPLADRPVIVVFLKEPMDLVKLLEKLPEVEEATQVAEVGEGAEDFAGTGSSESAGKKIQVRLVWGGHSLESSAVEKASAR